MEFNKPIADMLPGMDVEGFYILRAAALKTTNNGKPFLSGTICDRTGSVEIKIWDYSGPIGARPDDTGRVVKIRGSVSEYRGALQISVHRIRMADAADDYDTALLVPTAPIDADAALADVQRLVASITDADYRSVAETMLARHLDAFRRIPAGKSVHHSFLSGLLMHTYNMLRTADFLAGLYPEVIDRSLLLTGTLLHDFGKEREFAFSDLGIVTEYSTAGQLLGHLVMGAQEVADAARELGYILLTANTNNDAELEDQEISALRRYNVDGFLYAMMYHRKVDIPEALEGSLTVVVDSEDAAGKVPSIYPDDEMAGYDATNRLIQAGCRRIVYYGSATTVIAQKERLSGYRRALAEAGIAFNEALVVNVLEMTNAAAEAARVFDEIKPDGIFCFNDVRATFIYEAARERGVRIGTDVSVISIDNQPFITDVIKPSLTTLELPHYEMGFEAIRQLVAMLDGDKAVADLKSDHGMAVQRQRDGGKTALRCRIIERDSIVL